MLQLLHFRVGNIDDVWILSILDGVILMIVFGRVKFVERRELGNDGLREDMGIVQLLDISLGHLLLFVVGLENRAAILRSDVGTLPVERSRIMRDAEEDLE